MVSTTIPNDSDHVADHNASTVTYTYGRLFSAGKTTTKKLYPPSPYSLFFYDQMQKKQTLNATDPLNVIGHACSSQLPTTSLASSPQPLLKSSSLNNGNDNTEDDSRKSLSSPPASEQSSQKRRRSPTQFSNQVFKVTRLWNQLPLYEKQKWELCAETMSAMLEMNNTTTTTSSDDTHRNKKDNQFSRNV